MGDIRERRCARTKKPQCLRSKWVCVILGESKSKGEMLNRQTMNTLTNSQIDRLEKTLGIILPGLYRKLLIETGYGKTPFDRQLYHPMEIRPLYESFFHDSSQLFNPYFPFGCDNNGQELWVIDNNRELAASISHEAVPEDWPDELWLDYADWIDKYIPFLDSEL
jgi:hypothetical protein